MSFSHPIIIQGGMGVAVSGWRLARAVAQLGQLGVVSGTLLPVVLTRWLQLGDPGGCLAPAMAQFPIPGVADRVMERYFVPGGKPAEAPFRAVPMPTIDSAPALVELTVLANFVEVFLAKAGHCGRVGLNLLEKVQIPTLPSLYGAMLAGVDYVLMGAGIPRAIPGVLDAFSRGEAAELRLDVAGAPRERTHVCRFDPAAFAGAAAPGPLTRPKFFAIVSSAALATTLARKSSGVVDGFVIEGMRAGGHNAPPRGPLQLSAAGEPVYGPRDEPELEKFRALGLPFWLAGAPAHERSLAAAQAQGAAGIQVGTAFAFCDESGIAPDLKREVLRRSRAGEAHVFTDPFASPTGFPFKVVSLDGTLSQSDCYAARTRVCDLGYLRQPYEKADASLGYRCAAEPEAEFARKGGLAAETENRKCLCNALAATVGLGQVRPGDAALGVEPPIVTAGNELSQLATFVPPGRDSYSAADVIRQLLAG